MRKSLRAITVLAIITAWAVLPSSAAQAGLNHFMVCQPGTVVAGSFTSLTALMKPAVSLSPYVVETNGSINPCHQPTDGDLFAIAAYRPDGPAYGISGRYNALRTSFHLMIRVTPGTHALCLISSPTTRLDCYSLTWATNPETGALEHSVGAPVPTDSPLVQATPWINMTPSVDEQPDPGCMTCGDGGED